MIRNNTSNAGSVEKIRPCFPGDSSGIAGCRGVKGGWRLWVTKTNKHQDRGDRKVLHGPIPAAQGMDAFHSTVWSELFKLTSQELLRSPRTRSTPLTSLTWMAHPFPRRPRHESISIGGNAPIPEGQFHRDISSFSDYNALSVTSSGSLFVAMSHSEQSLRSPLKNLDSPSFKTVSCSTGALASC